MENVVAVIYLLILLIFGSIMVFAQLEIFSVSSDVKKIKKMLEEKEGE